MKILWFSWKDPGHPQAGGAEVVGWELMRRLAADGHEVRLVTSGHPGAPADEVRQGIAVLRLGGRWSVYWKAFRHYRRNLKGWADAVIDEINTVPFFCRLYVREPNLVFVHQLCREIWFYQMSWPLKLVGYLLEPLYLRALSGSRAVTVSESTRADLVRCGFRRERVAVIPQGIALAPLADLGAAAKYPEPTLLSLGSVRAMKRTHHIVRAFELAKQEMPGLKLIVAGEMGPGYGERVRRLAAASPYRDSIRCLGQVDERTKSEIMSRSHILCAASIKEGWGLTVSEAAGQGTPAVAYDVDGLRDSVRDGETGRLARAGDPADMARAVVDLLRDPAAYARLRRNGWELARTMTFDRSYQAFMGVISSL